MKFEKNLKTDLLGILSDTMILTNITKAFVTIQRNFKTPCDCSECLDFVTELALIRTDRYREVPY